MDELSCQFQISVKHFGNNLAILFCDDVQIINKLSYNELSEISNSIHMFLSKHVNKNSCIGIAFTTNPILVSCIMGIISCKSSFFCIDIGNMVEITYDIIKRLGIRWIVECNTPFFQKCFLQEYCVFIDSISFLNEYTIKLWSVKDVDTSVSFEKILYVMLTSGTTGINKIVRVPQNSIMSNINCLRKEFEISDKDIIYIGTPYTFDPFVIELFLALCTGACLLMVPPSIRINKHALLKTLFPREKNLHSGVTFVQMSPSIFLTFSESDIRYLIWDKNSLRVLALGGENFPSILKYHRPNLKVYNLYGITEVSCWASIEKIEKDEDVSLGTPLDDTILEVRDNNGKKITNGEGELFIGSSLRICFIDDEPINFTENKIIYRVTGDIVKVKNNKYYFIGRKDNIIKRYGKKLSLLEIEKLIQDHTELNSICVWDKKNSKLILFIILNENDDLIKNKIIDKLRIKLLNCLTKFQNPDIINIIPSIPLNKNGKTDYKCLLNLINNDSIHENLKPCEIFQNLWSRFFGLSEYQLKERSNLNFIEFGGNSVLAIQIISEFEKYFNENVHIPILVGNLLDSNKCYSDYIEYIEKNISGNLVKKRKNDIISHEEENLMKQLKFNDKQSITCVIKWKYNFNACVDSTSVYFNHSVLGGLIITGSHSHMFVILKALSGEVVSEIRLPDAIESSVCVSSCGEFVMIGCNDGFIYAINITNADIKWKFKTNSSIKCTPSLCLNNTCIIFGSYDKTLYCVQEKDGVLVWKNDISEIIKSMPVVDDRNSCVYVTTLQGSCLCLMESTGDILFHCKTNNPIFGAPCLMENKIIWADVKGHIFGRNDDSDDSYLCCKANGHIFSSICQYKNFIIIGCHDHNIYCFDVFQKFKEIFKINIGSQISTTPVIYNFNNKEYLLLCSNPGKLHVFDFQNQELLECLQLPGETFSSPCINNNFVYVGCRDNNLYCIEIKCN